VKKHELRGRRRVREVGLLLRARRRPEQERSARGCQGDEATVRSSRAKLLVFDDRCGSLLGARSSGYGEERSEAEHPVVAGCGRIWVVDRRQGAGRVTSVVATEQG
jgi:hypothetical protein